MTGGSGDGLSLRDYVAVVSSRRRLVLLVTGLAVALTTVALSLQTPMFKATSQILVAPATERSEVERLLFGAADAGSQQRVLNSPTVMRSALGIAGLPQDDAATARLGQHVSVGVVPASSVIEVTVSDPQAPRAARLAQAVSEAYLGRLRSDSQQRLVTAMSRIDVRAGVLRSELASVIGQLRDGAGSTTGSLELQRDELQAQLRANASRRTELETAADLARPAVIIREAVTPGSPATPRWPLGLGAAVVLGALLGVSTALLSEQTKTRVVGADGVARARGMPYLGVVPAADLGMSEPVAATAPASPAADAFDRLAVFVTAAQRGRPAGCVIAVVGVGGGGVAAPVAANLAASLSRAGRDCVLIDAAGEVDGVWVREDSWEAPPATSGMTHDPSPGARPLPVVSRDVPTASDGSFAGGLAGHVERVRGGGRQVIIAAPSVDESAVSLQAAASADIVLLAVQWGVREDRLAEGVAQIRRIGVTISGTVLVGQRRRRWPVRQPVPDHRPGR